MEYKLVTVQYFMDEMRLSELFTCTDSLDRIDRTSWEQTRIMCLISAQKVSKKKLRATDIFTLPWDNPELPDSALQMQMQQAKELEDFLNQQPEPNDGEHDDKS